MNTLLKLSARGCKYGIWPRTCDYSTGLKKEVVLLIFELVYSFSKLSPQEQDPQPLVERPSGIDNFDSWGYCAETSASGQGNPTFTGGSRSTYLDAQSGCRNLNSKLLSLSGKSPRLDAPSFLSGVLRMGRKSSKRARSPKPEEWYIRCVCGDPEEGKDDDDAWIACSSCGCWQHKVCMGVSPEDEELSENYKCEQCAPELHKELLAASARSVNLWEERRRAHEKQATEQEQIEHGDKKRSRKSDRKMRDSLSHSHGIDDTDEASKASNMNLFPLTDECHHYSHVSEVPWDIQK